MPEYPPFLQGVAPPPPAGSSVGTVFSRHDWGAASARRMLPALATPVTRVVNCWADVEPCTTPEECKQRAREVQRRHMEEQNEDDVKYNFMVGGDGNVYEGRGWYNQAPSYSPSLAYANDLNGKSVEIAFLDRIAEKPNDVLVRGMTDCVAYGLVTRFLQEKVQFYLRSPGEIRYLSSYQTNAPGISQTGPTFSDAPDPHPPPGQGPGDDKFEPMMY